MVKKNRKYGKNNTKIQIIKETKMPKAVKEKKRLHAPAADYSIKQVCSLNFHLFFLLLYVFRIT